jgi:hypothetical protein
MASEAVSAYSQKELRQLAKAFSLMGDDAISKAKTVSYDLANYAKTEITKAGYQREKSAKAVRKVVAGDVQLTGAQLAHANDPKLRALTRSGQGFTMPRIQGLEGRLTRLV